MEESLWETTFTKLWRYSCVYAQVTYSILRHACTHAWSAHAHTLVRAHTHTQQSITTFMDVFRCTFPSATIPVKMHMLDHTMVWVKARTLASVSLLNRVLSPYMHASILCAVLLLRCPTEWRGWETQWRSTSSASPLKMLLLDLHPLREESWANQKSSVGSRVLNTLLFITVLYMRWYQTELASESGHKANCWIMFHRRWQAPLNFLAFISAWYSVGKKCTN